MAKQIEAQITVTHYPRHPFGKHAGTYDITTRLGRENYEDDPVPLSGCALSDPLSSGDKDLLCALSLARVDAGGQFAVDYAALRAHLRAVCGVRDIDLHGLTWATVMQILRPAASEPERPLPLSKAAALIYEKLLTLKPHEAMLTREIQDWYEEATGSNLDEGTWKNLRKEMELYGLKNRPRVGYYIEQKMTL